MYILELIKLNFPMHYLTFQQVQSDIISKGLITTIKIIYTQSSIHPND